MARYWVVEATYPLPFKADLDNRLEQLAGPRTGSGAGFGQRDMDWTFTHGETAKEKLAILLEFAKSHEMTVRITEHDDEEDE